jgi:haloacetate dehalogenase
MFDPSFKQKSLAVGDVTINLRIGGSGPPLLLLHGYPQTHFMWQEVAPLLAHHFTLICPDLRGYGGSSKPAGNPDHSNYSKRTMAKDQVRIMSALGYGQFSVAGHDRGARVAHRMALDYPDKVIKIAVLDIAPTLTMFDATDQTFATGYYHWFFLIQPNGLPEHMIGLDPDFYLKEKLKRWSGNNFKFKPEVVAEYSRYFRDPATIHASCEDYRAAATIDLEHDRESSEQMMTQPLLVLWGKQGFIEHNFNVLECWRKEATHVEGYTLNCGHFLAEEKPQELATIFIDFFQPDHSEFIFQ